MLPVALSYCGGFTLSITYLAEKKQSGHPITMVTCYDAWSAKLLQHQSIDCLLVGDSVAMVVHGYESTIHATVTMMVDHTAAVARSASSKQLLIADMPFMSYRQGMKSAVQAATQLMQAGAGAIKLEGADGNLDSVAHLVESGIPVMGHLGLTPQAIHQLGGHKLQAKSEQEAHKLCDDAIALEKAGCFSIVLECVPEALGKIISEQLTIPVIGIGAGRYVDGQVLVLHDLLGLSGEFKPKFLRHFAEGEDFFTQGITSFVDAVENKTFPNDKEVYRPISTKEAVS